MTKDLYNFRRDNMSKETKNNEIIKGYINDILLILKNNNITKKNYNRNNVFDIIKKHGNKYHIEILKVNENYIYKNLENGGCFFKTHLLYLFINN